MRQNSPLMAVKPIFVVGSPRSGTTMIGNYIGSAKSVLNAGEYRAFYLAYGALPVQLIGTSAVLNGLTPPEWEPHRLRYIAEVQRHAVEFIIRATESEGRTAFCDASPRNLLVIQRLLEIFPDALLVLTLRHYTGVIQSLLRLGTVRVLPGTEPSMDWVDPTAVACGALWSRHYQNAFHLPRERLVVFGYDRFCADPESVLARFKARLGAVGFPIDELDDGVFAKSHATPADRPRSTIGGSGMLAPIPSFDRATWLPEIERDVQPAVTTAHHQMWTAFPDDYAEPAGYPGVDALLASAQARH